YALFTANNCGFYGEADATYGGYSVNLPSGATITKVSALALHYESPPPIYYAPQLWIQNKSTLGVLCYCNLQIHYNPTLDAIDITSLKSHWTTSDFSKIQIVYYDYDAGSSLDWLPLRIEYTLPSVYQNGP